MGLRDQNNGKKIGINGSRIYDVTTLQNAPGFPLSVRTPSAPAVLACVLGCLKFGQPAITG